jgi:hypothetical protein
MNEAAWATSADAEKMLAFLLSGDPPSNAWLRWLFRPSRPPKPPSDRKLRLFCVACVRNVWGTLSGGEHRRAVETAELFADRKAGLEDLRTDYAAAHASRSQASAGPPPSPAALNAALSAEAAAELGEARSRVLRCAAAARAAGDAARGEPGAEGRVQCDLLRDIFAPFGPTERPGKSRLPHVQELAVSAYESRVLPGGTLDAFSLQMLADALEEAGSGDNELIEHLHRQQAHVRGCWALDLVLPTAPEG